MSFLIAAFQMGEGFQSFTQGSRRDLLRRRQWFSTSSDFPSRGLWQFLQTYLVVAICGKENATGICGQKSETLLNTLQCTGRAPKDHLARMLTEPKCGSPELRRFLDFVYYPYQKKWAQSYMKKSTQSKPNELFLLPANHYSLLLSHANHLLIIFL